MAKDITLKSPNGEEIYYPKTVSDLVYDNESGKTVKEEIENTSNRVERLFINNFDYPTRVIDNSYLHDDGNVINNFGRFYIEVFDVERLVGRSIYVNGKTAGNHVVTIAFFNSSDISSETLISTHLVMYFNEVTSISELIEIPTNAKVLTITYNKLYDIKCQLLSEYDECINAKELDLETNINSNSEQINLIKDDISNINTECDSIKYNINNILSSKPVFIGVVDNCYINQDGVITSGFKAYRVELYSMQGFDNFNITGSLKGYQMALCAFYKYGSTKEELNEDGNCIDIAIKYSDNSTIKPISFNGVSVPQEGNILAVTRLKETEDYKITKNNVTTKDLDDFKEEVNNKISTFEDKLIESKQEYNSAWEIKMSVDKMLSSYNTHFIDLWEEFNNLYDFGNVTVTNSFIVPNLNGTVEIQVSNNPKIRRDSVSMFNVGNVIYIGTKEVYDEYQITAINNLTFTCKLIKCNTNFIGCTFNATTEFRNSVTVNNTLRVFRKEDILAYQSKELPMSVSFDNVHPTDEGYLIMGEILGRWINSKQLGKKKFYCFGDSFTHDSRGWETGLKSIFGDDVVIFNHGKQGDRVEHIIKRFETFMETYTPNDDDFFIFVMGTNNLADIFRYNGTDSTVKLYNQSYLSIFKDGLSVITKKLPLGNWSISNGHINSLKFWNSK